MAVAITEIWLSRYTLNAKKTLNHKTSGSEISGALLKVVFSSKKIGFTSVQPWQVFADVSLEEQLTCLANGKVTNLIESALEFAAIDSSFRLQNKSMWTDDEAPNNHFNLGDLLYSKLEGNIECIGALKSKGFDCFKIKANNNIDLLSGRLNQISELVKGISWRIDFNSILTVVELNAFWLKLSDNIRTQIDFIEDPFLVNKNSLAKINKEIPLGIDFEISNLSKIKNYEDSIRAINLKALVIKPAAQKVDVLIKKWAEIFPKIIFTSYQDHPVGQCLAAYYATKYKKILSEKVDACGLNSHWSFSENTFSKTWFAEGESPKFKNPIGTGFGFNEELSSLDWQRLL